MKKLLLFAIGFIIFAVAGLFMYSRPYTTIIEHRGQPVEIMLYKDFYVGLPYWLFGVALMFISFVYEGVAKYIHNHRAW